MALGVDYTSGVGYINAGGNAITQPVCLNTRGENVGIGLTSPTERLEVTGDVFINNPTSKLYLGVKNNYILGDANNMAIRTSTPTSNLNVKGDTKLEGSLKIHCQYPTLPFESFYYKNSGNPAYANNYRFYKANGTRESPTNILKDDLLRAIQGHGYDTVLGWHTIRCASLVIYASENHSPTLNGGYITIQTTPEGTTGPPTERLRVTQSGNIGIGITSPTTKLDVVSDIKASSSIISFFEEKSMITC